MQASNFNHNLSHKAPNEYGWEKAVATHNIEINHRCTNPGYAITWATKFCKMESNICGFSVWNLNHVNLLAPVILWCLLVFFENMWTYFYVWTPAIDNYKTCFVFKSFYPEHGKRRFPENTNNHPWKYGAIQNTTTIFTAMEISKPI